MAVKNFLLMAVLLVLTSKLIAAIPSPSLPPHVNSTFQDARHAFHKEDYDTSLSLLQKYYNQLLTMPRTQALGLFRFTAVAAMGTIFLQYKHDPRGAIEWFEKMKKSQLLSEAEEDIVDGWIGGIHEWIKLGKSPKNIQSPEELYSLGKKYYEAGLKKQKYLMDTAGSIDFSLATTYLVPMIVRFDKHSRIGDALFMMGDIRRRTWYDSLYWSENYYLTEVIRRFPATPLAVKAYRALNDDVHFGYTGTSGDHTPASWIELLAEFKKLAFEKPVKKTAILERP